MDAKICKQHGKLILRLDKGEEIMRELTIFLRKNNIQAGSVMGIGAVENVVLKYFHPTSKEYSDKTFEGEYEVLSLMGNISTVDNQIFPHLHISLSDDNFNAFGGHLASAVVSVTLELIINPLEGEIEREFSEEIGLHLMKLSRPNRVIPT